MQDPIANDDDTINPGTSASDQSDQYFLSLFTYREVIQSLSQILIKTSWLQLKGNSQEINTVEFQLRDTIFNLEQLDQQYGRSEVDLDAILAALYQALEELIWAANLADEPRVDTRSRFSGRLIECRKQLHLAIGLLPSRNV